MHFHPRPLRTNRRTFLSRAAQRRRVVTLSCERLYMRYVDAVGAGQTPQFLAGLERDLSAADEVCLTGSEWLTPDRFRSDLEPLLRACRRATRLT